MSDPSFEAKLAELEAIVRKLESPDIALDETVALFKRGKALAADCQKLLADARNEISVLAKDGTLSPFTEDTYAKA